MTTGKPASKVGLQWQVSVMDKYNREIDHEVYITRGQNTFKYINSPHGPGCCPVCSKKTKNLTAHHVIPVRITKHKGPLGELRIRICTECHRKTHPENRLIEAIVKLVSYCLETSGGQIENIKEFRQIRELVNFGQKDKTEKNTTNTNKPFAPPIMQGQMPRGVDKDRK